MAFSSVGFAGSFVYDDFSGSTLDLTKWSIFLPDEGVNEYYVDTTSQNFHVAQTFESGDVTRGLVVRMIGHNFISGEKLDFDFSYVSGSGNRAGYFLLYNLNNVQIATLTEFGNWNGEFGIGNMLGLYRYHIEFYDNHVNVNVTKPDNSVYNNVVNVQMPYNFVFAANNGHNGMMHFDYDNFIISNTSNEPLPPNDATCWNQTFQKCTTLEVRSLNVPITNKTLYFVLNDTSIADFGLSQKNLTDLIVYNSVDASNPEPSDSLLNFFVSYYNVSGTPNSIIFVKIPETSNVNFMIYNISLAWKNLTPVSSKSNINFTATDLWSPTRFGNDVESETVGQQVSFFVVDPSASAIIDENSALGSGTPEGTKAVHYSKTGTGSFVLGKISTTYNTLPTNRIMLFAYKYRIGTIQSDDLDWGFFVSDKRKAEISHVMRDGNNCLKYSTGSDTSCFVSPVSTGFWYDVAIFSKVDSSNNVINSQAWVNGTMLKKVEVISDNYGIPSTGSGWSFFAPNGNALIPSSANVGLDDFIITESILPNETVIAFGPTKESKFNPPQVPDVSKTVSLNLTTQMTDSVVLDAEAAGTEIHTFTKWNISDIPQNKYIRKAVFCPRGYGFNGPYLPYFQIEAGGSGAWTELDDISTIFDQSKYNAKNYTYSFSSNNTFYCTDVTEQFEYGYTNTYPNATFYFYGPWNYNDTPTRKTTDSNLRYAGSVLGIYGEIVFLSEENNINPPFGYMNVTYINFMNISVYHSPSSPLFGENIIIASNASSNAGTNVANIKIFLDGANVSECYPYSPSGACTYSDSGLVVGNHTYYAVAIDVLGNVNREPEYDAYSFYVRDGTPPNISVYHLPLNPTFGENVTLYANALDEEELNIQIFLDGVNVATCSSSFCDYNASNLSVGSHSYYVTARDMSGNNASTEIMVFTITDVVPPTVFVYHTPENPLLGDYVTIIVNASDDAGLSSIWIYLDDFNVATCSSSSCIFNTYPTIGNHTYYAIVTDTSNNTSRDPAEGSKLFFVRDITPPLNLTVFHSPSNPTYGENVIFEAYASDEGGLQYMDIFLDDINVRTCSFNNTYEYSSCSYSITSLLVGNHTYYATATDVSGNVARYPVEGYEVFYLADVTPPTVSVSHSPQYPVLGNIVTIIANVFDNVNISSIEIYLDNVNVLSCSSSPCMYTNSSLLAGNHAYWAVARDPSENIGRDPINGSRSFFVRDITPPIISNVSVSSINQTSAVITWVTNELSSSLTKYGTSSGVYINQKNGTANVTTHSVSLFELTPSTRYYFVVNSTDAFNNTAQSGENSFTTSNDTTSPTLFVYHNPSYLTIGNNVTIIANASDDVRLSSIIILIDYVNVKNCSSSPCIYTKSGLMYGNHTYYAVARDTSGNSATDPTIGTKSFYVTDITPPAVSVGHAPSNPMLGQTVTVTAVASDNIKLSGLMVVVDNTEIATCSSSPCNYTNSNLSAGIHTYYAFAIDSSGNTARNPSIGSKSFYVNDTTASMISNIIVSSISSDSATITWTTNKFSSSLVKYGKTPGLYTSLASGASGISHSVQLSGLRSMTTYYFVVNSTDMVGNSNQSEELSFTTKELVIQIPEKKPKFLDTM